MERLDLQRLDAQRDHEPPKARFAPWSFRALRRAGKPARRLGSVVLALLMVWAAPCSFAAAGVILSPTRAIHPDTDHGALLLGELNCAACHAAEDAVRARLDSRHSPRLGRSGLRLTPQFLRAFLSDPQAAKPGTTMPDLLHGKAAADKAEALEALVHFLVSLQEASVGRAVPGEPLGPAARRDASPYLPPGEGRVPPRPTQENGRGWNRALPTNGAPVVGADSFTIEQGRQLYHQVGCVACHAPQEPASALSPKADHNHGVAAKEELEKVKEPSAPLGNLAQKLTVSELARFLSDPLAVRPSGRMPSLNLSPVEARAIAMYLLREQAELGDPAAARPRIKGLSYQYFEGRFNRTADMDSAKVKASGLTDKFTFGPRQRQENIGFRFTGFLTVPATGAYTFYTTSDDGSRLFLDGRLVVDNDGHHGATEEKGSVELKAGDHSMMVTWFNAGGEAELKVSWAGPGFSKQPISASALATDQGQPMVPLGEKPFAPDAGKAARGRELFASLGCATCHALGAEGAASTLKAKALAALDLSASGGCLSVTPGERVPRYSLSDAQRTALRSTLAKREALAKPRSAREQVNYTLSALNCLACHTRDDTGGPEIGRSEYFRMVGEEDLGDEGRLPPHLTKTGAKLNPDWLRRVLQGKGSARPYMATRMPQFGEMNVGHLVDAFVQADNPERTEAPPPDPAQPVGQASSLSKTSDLAEAKWGRLLVGTGGLSCISCHTFASHKSLGIPAIDLALTAQRLRKDWFRRYLLDPPSLRPGTRMPSFWPEGKSARPDLLEGHVDRQISAIWSYLARGGEAGLPPGLIRGKMELVATNEPLIYRNFITGAGVRAIGVGYPEKGNLAFDANDLRLALLWQGPFIDAAVHRIGRGDGFAPPLGYGLVKLPTGAAFAFLTDTNAPWPSASGKTAGYRMQGYTLNERRRPTFLYAFGEIAIEDRPEPLAGEVEAFFRRTLILRAPQPVNNLWFRAWVGSEIERQPDGGWMGDGKVMLRLSGDMSNPLLRRSAGQKELLVPLRFQAGQAELVEEIVW